jgi:hypothetical protein
MLISKAVISACFVLQHSRLFYLLIGIVCLFSNEVFATKGLEFLFKNNNDCVQLVLDDTLHNIGPKKKFYISGIPILSSNPVVGVAFGLALNGVFCIGGNTNTTRFSSVTFIPTYTTKKQATVVLRNYLYLMDDKYIITGDLLWKKFPSYNNGLGASTPDAWANEVTPIGVKFSQAILKRMVTNFYAGVGFNLHLNYDIRDGGSNSIREYLSNQTNTEANQVWESIDKEIPYVLKDESRKQSFISDWQNMPIDSLQLTYFNSPFSLYKTGYGNQLNCLGFNIGATYDSRDNLNTPGKGIYASVKYELFAKGLVNEQQFSILSTDIRFYKVIGNQRNVLAFWNYNSFGFNNVPFILLPANATDPSATSARGYKGLRYRGFNYLSAELEYRRHLWKPLGMVIFTNAHSVSENSIYLKNQNLPANWDGKIKHINLAYGLGARIQLNKTSRATLNFDYAWDVKGNGNFYMAMNAVF